MKNKKKIKINNFIDHTNVKPFAQEKEIKKICQEAIKHNFKGVCVTSSNVKVAKKFLENSSVNLISVIGFPHGTASLEAKVFETKKALADGAEEIDFVVNVGKIKEKKYDQIFQEMKEIVQAGEFISKCILEIGYLERQELKECCLLAEKAGVDFIKTSTGYGPRGVKIKDIKWIKEIVGNRMKIKASGGVRNRLQALKLIKAGADRIGTSTGVKLTK